MNRKECLEKYRKMSLEELIDLKLNGSYVAGVLEQAIIEKAKEKKK